MGYSSSLSDQEWEIIKPLLPKKKDPSTNMDKTANIRWSILPTQEWM